MMMIGLLTGCVEEFKDTGWTMSFGAEDTDSTVVFEANGVSETWEFPAWSRDYVFLPSDTTVTITATAIVSGLPWQVQHVCTLPPTLEADHGPYDECETRVQDEKFMLECTYDWGACVGLSEGVPL
jgi:hypothetical protein